jgi:hypothetical protein
MTILRPHLHNHCVKTAAHKAGSVSCLVSSIKLQTVIHVPKKPPASFFILEVFIFKMDQERFSEK